MKLYLDIVLRDEMGNVHAQRVSEVPEYVAFKGERYKDDLTDPFTRLGDPDPFETVVEAMKVRELRKHKLAEYCKNMGYTIAEHLEDREGWHGLDRQEKTNDYYRDRE